jgi:two-component system sensor histidine kinase and response regulator WspE
VNPRDPEDLSNISMLELFRAEAETQTAILTSGLLELERGATGPQPLEMLMRAAHSLKGAARIVHLHLIVQVAHAMEDCFVAAQHGRLQLRQPGIDTLFRGVDLLAHAARRGESELAAWEAAQATEIKDFLAAVTKLVPPAKAGAKGRSAGVMERWSDEQTQAALGQATPSLHHSTTPSLQHSVPSPERVVRLTAENLNRLLGLAGESLVESRWLRPFADSLQRLKRQHADLAHRLDGLRHSLPPEELDGPTAVQLDQLLRTVAQCQQFLTDRVEDLDNFDRRSAQLSHRLYLEVLRTRLRPFAEGVRRFPRMVRDLARSLGKEVRLDIVGEHTPVDRDLLERLETPLAHLLRNAVDHGCETREQRERAGKSLEGVIRLEARHSAGLLLVTVADDGPGVDPEHLRRLIVQNKLAPPDRAEKLVESELFEFLFLPGFTMAEAVTEISGRGVGLDVVQNMVKSVRGAVRLSTQPGRGLRVQLQLPLTLSVLRALLVEVAGEPYAIPLSRITRALKLRRDQIEVLQGRRHFQLDGCQVGLLTAHQVLDCGHPKSPPTDLPVVVLGDRQAHYGLVVDRFLGERELVVQPLDPRLGKVQDISAAALMEDGSPVLIVDVDGLLGSIEKLLAAPPKPFGASASAPGEGPEAALRTPKRVLAVDDSLSVRELERKLLISRGYLADVAVDGLDAWNAVRTGQYDLVVTDVDMPRMDGIELATRIKNDPRLQCLPVLIVSYKDDEEGRRRGLEAGADFFLTKGSFHDEALLQAVVGLIGEPDA